MSKVLKNRPKDVRKRESFGHWELDTVVSKSRKVKILPFNFCRKKKQILNRSSYG